MATDRLYLGIFLFTLALAVILGAFGAHILEDKISPKYTEIYKTATFYHFIHAIGAILSILIIRDLSPERISMIAKLFLGGIILFSGSLYILSIHEIFDAPGLRKLGAITPIGGLLFIAAWVYVGITVLKS